MKRKSIVVAAALAAVLGVGTLAYSAASNAQPYGGAWGYGPGWMHGGYGPGPGSGPGWCWGNYGRYGAAGPATQSGPTIESGQAGQQQTKLTVDDVKARMERWLAYQGTPHLKLGDVKEKDANTITADIVTTDNSLVQRFDVDRNTGFYRPADGDAGPPANQKEGK